MNHRPDRIDIPWYLAVDLGGQVVAGFKLFSLDAHKTAIGQWSSQCLSQAEYFGGAEAVGRGLGGGLQLFS